MKKLLALTAVFIFSLAASPCQGEIPHLINYQGMLTDDGGNSLDGTYDLTFKIYASESGDDSLWWGYHTGIQVTDGLFNIILGSLNALDLAFDEDYWLGITVGTESELSPRIRLTSVGYAYRALVADSALVATPDSDSHWSVNDSTLYTNQYWGIARGGVGNVLNGDSAHTMVNLGIGCTTGQSASNDQCVTISGGKSNRAYGTCSTVGGGSENFADDWWATVCGGAINYAGGQKSTVAGGLGNSATGSYSIVGGGEKDTSKAYWGGVFSGRLNLAGDDQGDTAAFVGGGYGNNALDWYATVCGGRENNAQDRWSTVGGGAGNTCSNTYTTVAGGGYNTAEGMQSVVGGGWMNTATGRKSTVAGGLYNHAYGWWSTVGGGYFDTVIAVHGGVFAGYSNLAGDDHDDSAAFVGGGYDNSATRMWATVCGGKQNTASGIAGTVCGGLDNSNSGNYSVIPGGFENTLAYNAHISMVFGRGVYVDNPYRVVLFNDSYSGRLGINRDDSIINGIYYPIHVGTDATNGNGAYLSNDGQWTNASSKNFKTDFKSLNQEEILAQISSLTVESWRYKGSRGRHIGPYAEDFARIFSVGNVKEDGTIEDKYLAATDVAGVALAGVKELIQQNQELMQTIEQLKQKVAELERKK